MKKILPIVALVGPGNVGKSTLFNRLAPSVRSMTFDYPGITRDIVRDTVVWQDTTFTLVDTGGFQLHEASDSIDERVRQKALATLDKADLIVLIVDGAQGPLQRDQDLAEFLRRYNKPVIIAVNKMDRRDAQEALYDFYSLPHEEILGISAQHGKGINTLLSYIVDRLPEKPEQEEEKIAYSMTLLGRPNVGKSSLMNALLKEERMIVSDQPGTTRDPLAERIFFYRKHIEITDTPGIRRRRSVSGAIESIMVKRSLAAVKRSDIVVLMIDATEQTIVDQELKLAFYVFEELHKALVILINKTDALDEEGEEKLQENLDKYEHLMKRIPVLRISCKSGKNIGKVIPLLEKVWERHTQEFSEDELTYLFTSALRKRPLVRNKQHLKIHRAWQVDKAPIAIAIKVNYPDWFEASQLQFLENLMRKSYDLIGVAIKFSVRSRR